jgi:hypothetical protein
METDVDAFVVVAKGKSHISARSRFKKLGKAIEHVQSVAEFGKREQQAHHMLLYRGCFLGTAFARDRSEYTEKHIGV